MHVDRPRVRSTIDYAEWRRRHRSLALGASLLVPLELMTHISGTRHRGSERGDIDAARAARREAEAGGVTWLVAGGIGADLARPASLGENLNV